MSGAMRCAALIAPLRAKWPENWRASMATNQLVVNVGPELGTSVVFETVKKACETGLKVYEKYSEYLIVREHRYVLEAKLDAEIRKSEIELEALHARLKASVEFLCQTQRHNAEQRAVFAKLFEAGHEAVKVYVKIHADRLAKAKTPEDMEHAEAVWHVIVPFIEQMNEATRLVSRQTLAWLE